jgi:aryl-alcohol dehydrogenase-like predicted oxidoreductase
MTSVAGVRRLGATDIEITPIGLGSMQFSSGGFIGGQVYPAMDRAVADDVVGAALDAGIGWFDTAEMYGKGHSERLLSHGLSSYGVAAADAVIATKWTPLLRTAENIRTTIGDRLAALDPYPVSLHQIHAPQGGLSSLPAQLGVMADLLADGRIRAVGVSNFSAAQMEKAHAVLAVRGVTLASNQVQISLLHRNIERDGTLAAAKRLGITLIASSPLRMGTLTGKFHEQPAAVKSLPWMRRTIAGLSPKGLARTEPLIRELVSIGSAYGVGASVVALSWLITYYGDTVVGIPGASKPAQARDSAAAMSLRLTEKELERLDGLPQS